MAQFIIPIAANPNQNVRVVLSNTVYFINIRYNTRLDTYTFSLLDAAQNPIISGVRIVPQYSLLSGTVDERKPPGKLFAIDMSRTGDDCSFADLGQRVLLAYDEDQ